MKQRLREGEKRERGVRIGDEEESKRKEKEREDEDERILLFMEEG